MGVDTEISLPAWILSSSFVLGGSCGSECAGAEVVGGRLIRSVTGAICDAVIVGLSPMETGVDVVREETAALGVGI